MFSRRVTLFLLAAVILLSIALRYPLVDHERYQADSYFIHSLSESIVREGYAMWTIDSLSYFGYYPLSYPSGAPFLFAELSILTGLSMEFVVLLSGMAFAVLFCLVIFCLGREFVIRPEISLIAVLLASVGPRFVDTTYWVGSARGPVIVLMLLLLLLTFRANSKRCPALYPFAALVGFSCFAMHHMAVIIVLFGFSYLGSSFLAKYLVPAVSIGRSKLAYVYVAIVTATILVFISVFDDPFVKAIASNFSGPYLFDFKPAVLSTFMNMAASYTNQIGFILPVAFIGIFVILKGRDRISTTDVFPVLVLIVFLPLLGSSLYISMILLFFVAIICAISIGRMFNSPRSSARVLAATFVFVLLFSSITLPVLSVNNWNSNAYVGGDTTIVDDTLFNDANYLRENYPDEYAVSNVQTATLRLAAFSDMRFLKSGVFSTLSGDIGAAELRGNVTRSGEGFPRNIYVWFTYKEDRKVDLSVELLMRQGVEGFYSAGSISQNAREYFSSHSRLVVVISNSWQQEFVTDYDVLIADFPGELRNGEWLTGGGAATVYHTLPSYLAYQSHDFSVYLAELPS